MIRHKTLMSLLGLCVLAISCTSSMRKITYEAGPPVYTLQLLHFSDVDGNEELALGALEKFSALVEGFKADSMYGKSTLLVSSGDNIIPGPRFYAAEQSKVRAVTGSNEPGSVDIAFLNNLGVTASALGNHELDAGPGELADALQSEEKDGVVFPGSLFPYLSANLDFSTDEDVAELVGTNGADVSELHGKLAAYAVTEINGEKIGLVGGTTPRINQITTAGKITVKPEDSNSIEALAAEIQRSVDALSASGVNKIVLLTHMQQIQVEMELSSFLKDVDVIVAGGSNTRMGDKTDKLFMADKKFETNYPYAAADSEGKPTLIVNVDGDYKYLGRLVVSFDATGTVVLSSLDDNLNGAWASTEENLEMLNSPKPNAQLIAVRDATRDVINDQYGNVVGYTSVYLDGRRSQVRTQETNLGNLSADANLWYANQLSDVPVDISIKNGGGLRTEIGSTVVPPGTMDYSRAILSAPVENKEAGTQEGSITEGHLKVTLRFDNGLVTLTATAQELKDLIEHGVSETAEGVTPGAFPQIGGMRFSFSPSKPAGSRVISLDVLNADGSVKDAVVAEGVVQGDSNRTFRLVTLNFLANGGDDYPYDKLKNPDRKNLYEGKGFGEDVDYPDENLSKDPGKNNSFSRTGKEQEALAEYLMAFYPTPDKALSDAETDRDEDKRIIYQ